jgi:hypothetical protein
MYIVIEKDNKIITQGLVDEYAPPNHNRRDISLIATKQFKEYLLNDESLKEESKLLDIVDREYYDFNTGVLIRIYNNKKLIKYFEEQTKSKE